MFQVGPDVLEFLESLILIQETETCWYFVCSVPCADQPADKLPAATTDVLLNRPTSAWVVICQQICVCVCVCV